MQTSGWASKTFIFIFYFFFNSRFLRLLPCSFATVITSPPFHLPSTSLLQLLRITFLFYMWFLSDRSLWRFLPSRQKGRKSSCKSPLPLSSSTSPGQANCSVNALQCSKPKKWLHLPYVVQPSSEGFISLCTSLHQAAHITHISSALCWAFFERNYKSYSFSVQWQYFLIFQEKCWIHATWVTGGSMSYMSLANKTTLKWWIPT